MKSPEFSCSSIWLTNVVENEILNLTDGNRKCWEYLKKNDILHVNLIFLIKCKFNPYKFQKKLHKLKRVIVNAHSSFVLNTKLVMLVSNFWKLKKKTKQNRNAWLVGSLSKYRRGYWKFTSKLIIYNRSSSRFEYFNSQYLSESQAI